MSDKCTNCGQEIPYDFDLPTGAVFLHARDHFLYGLTCEKCQRISFWRSPLEDLERTKRQPFSREDGDRSLYEGDLAYDSFPYHIEPIRRLSSAVVTEYLKLLSGNYGMLQRDEIVHSFDTNPDISDSYCSYHLGDFATGPTIGVWWYRKSDIRNLLRIEARGTMVFPRYRPYDPFDTAIQNFCWKYSLKSILRERLNLSGNLDLGMSDEEIPSGSPGLDRNRAFLFLLKDDPAGNSLGRRGPRLDIIDKMLDEFENAETQNILSCLSLDFISEYKNLVRRQIPRPQGIGELRKEYLDSLFLAISNGGKHNFPATGDNDLYLHEIETLERTSSDLENEGKHKVVLLKSDTLTAREYADREIGKEIAEMNDVPEEEDSEPVLPRDMQVRKEMAKLETEFPLLKEIVTNDQELIDLKYKAVQIAKLDTDVLILGETGTGKELFARVIHQASGREGNLVPINCGAIPKDLVESELFGHKKGAFSGAVYDKVGAFEYANKGTLFLDEIGEMPLQLQAKILRAIECRLINRVGEVKPTSVDIKIVFATNRDLKTEVDSGNFREDLYFRIFSPCFRIIPLRERKEDIPILIDHFLQCFNKKYKKEIQWTSHSLANKLRRMTYDGNVREMMKMIEMAVINAVGPVIGSKDIPLLSKLRQTKSDASPEDDQPSDSKITDEQIKYWMEKLNNNKSKVARRLGVTYRTILRRSKAIYQ